MTTNYFIQRLLLQKKTTTKGQWKLPEHTLICMTVRHLFRSRELTTMLNRLGHSETYRFALGLETAIAKALQGSSKLLSTQIVANPGHCQSIAGIPKPSVHSDSRKPSSHCQSIAGIPKPSVHSSICKPCGHCQSIAGILKPSVHSDSCKPCGHYQSVAGVLKTSVHSDSCKPCGLCQRNATFFNPSVPSYGCEPCGHRKSIGGVLKPSVP